MLKDASLQRVNLFSFEEPLRISELILSQLTFLNIDYPNFNDWYNKKVLPGVRLKQREVIVYIIKSRLAGICILKNDHQEKKISTVRVFPEFRHYGIGTEIFRDAFDRLGTAKPVATVSEARYPELAKLMRKYNFKLSDKNNLYMRNNNDELFFNF